MTLCYGFRRVRCGWEVMAKYTGPLGNSETCILVPGVCPNLCTLLIYIKDAHPWFCVWDWHPSSFLFCTGGLTTITDTQLLCIKSRSPAVLNFQKYQAFEVTQGGLSSCRCYWHFLLTQSGVKSGAKKEFTSSYDATDQIWGSPICCCRVSMDGAHLPSGGGDCWSQREMGAPQC